MSHLKLLITLFFLSLFASENSYSNYENLYLPSSPIMIEKKEDRRERRESSYSSSYKRRRKKLENRNDKAIADEVESIRLEEERKLSRKIKKAFRRVKEEKNGYRVLPTNISSEPQNGFYGTEESRSFLYLSKPIA